jgi:hypothetical protein
LCIAAKGGNAPQALAVTDCIVAPLHSSAPFCPCPPSIAAATKPARISAMNPPRPGRGSVDPRLDRRAEQAEQHAHDHEADEREIRLASRNLPIGMPMKPAVMVISLNGIGVRPWR